MLIEKFSQTIFKPFLGSGITRRWSFLRTVLKLTYQFKQKRLIPVKIPLQSKLWVSNQDLGVGVFLLTKGEYEPLTTRVLLENLNPGEIFFDIGANIGYYTILASKRTGQKGRVVAFEPAPENIELLEKNLALNNCGNVEIVKKAVGGLNQSTQLYLSGSSWGEHSLVNFDPKAKALPVKMITLDQWIRQNQRQPDFLKIDVEGAEMRVLQGAKKLLASQKSLKIVIEIFPEGLQKANSSPKEIVRKLLDSGFSLQILDEPTAVALNFNHKTLENLLCQQGYTNLFCQR